jgi:hypothetical protein
MSPGDPRDPPPKAPKHGTAPLHAVVHPAGHPGTSDDGADDADEAGVASTVALPVIPDMRDKPIIPPTKASELAMTECPVCHVATPVARFCSDCGAPLVLRRFCAECGGHLAQGANYCDACGTKVP